jgi:hypothetical protein
MNVSGEREKKVQAERPTVRILAEFDPIQADRLVNWTWEGGNEKREAGYLKRITGVWGILRWELAHERIIS